MEASLHENSRNGMSLKTVATEIGDVELVIPRDRNGTFTPMLVPKGQRRLDGLDGMIISLYAGGMTLRDIQHHLASTIGTEISHETISKIVDQIGEEILIWQQRPLEALYPVIFLNAIVVKVRDGGHVRNKAAHFAIGIDMEGIKHVLGIWLQANESTTFWAAVCAKLANRGVRDVLIICCDGLTGFPEAVEATWPEATVQTCVVHLIRAAMWFVSYGDRKAVAAALKPIYQAANAETAPAELAAFEATEPGRRYPSTSKAFRDAWERFTPFLAFPPELRRVIYTTNSIESLNYQLRKVTKNRGHFPNEHAVVKLLWLAICDIEDRRQTSARPGERAKSPHRATQSTRTPRRGPGHDELETSTATALTGLPRPHQPPPLTTMTANAYTKNLTGSGFQPLPARCREPRGSSGPR